MIDYDIYEEKRKEEYRRENVVKLEKMICDLKLCLANEFQNSLVTNIVNFSYSLGCIDGENNRRKETYEF